MELLPMMMNKAAQRLFPVKAVGVVFDIVVEIRIAFGIQLGTLAAHGESGVIAPGPEMFARLTSNPFYDLMAARIRTVLEEGR